jgi:hypothetical protein
MSVLICTIMNLVASISLEFQVFRWSETSKDSLDCVLNGQDQQNKATMSKYIDRYDLAEGKEFATGKRQIVQTNQISANLCQTSPLISSCAVIDNW